MGDIMGYSYVTNKTKDINTKYIPQASVKNNKPCLTWLERLELQKAMMGRGIDYETTEQILIDFQKRMDRF